MAQKLLYRVRFVSQDKIYEVYARECYQGDMYGFVILEGLEFDHTASVVVDPSEEKIKSEFAGVNRTIIPMHSVIRIDEVEKRGASKIADLDGNVAAFPSPIYTPKSTD